MDGEYYRELVRPIFRNRRWLIAVDVLQGGTALAAELADLGAERSFVLAGSMGIGDLPQEQHAASAVIGTSGATIMTAMRAAAAGLRRPPDGVQAQIDSWDPDATARALQHFQPSTAPVAGRSPYGARRPEWAALEDKMVIDGLWDAAGVARAPSEIVAADGRSMTAAAGRLDRGAGTAWVADNTEGWHGGGEYLRWVQTDEDARAAIAFFEAHARRVRVMPFLDGIPCSIHGLVVGEDVLTFNPVEMVILRVPGQRRLVYAGTSTWWNAPERRAAEMRTVARRVALRLRDSVGYRGGFSVDGVLTKDGFRPTELNPRFSVGLGMQFRRVERLPELLAWTLVEGEDLDYRAADLGGMVMEAAGNSRMGRAHIVVPRGVDEVECGVVFVDGRAEVAAEGTAAEATLSYGPGPTGGIVRVRPDPDRTRIGDWLAPRAVAAFALADELWDAGIGPLETAVPA